MSILELLDAETPGGNQGYGWKTRQEVLFFKRQLNQMKWPPGLSLPDGIRHLEAEVRNFKRLADTCVGGDPTDKQIADQDLLLILYNNLSPEVLRFVQLHSEQDTFVSAQRAVLRYHERAILSFQDLDRNKPRNQVHVGLVNANVVCFQCGQKGHFARDCKAGPPGTGKGNLQIVENQFGTLHLQPREPRTLKVTLRVRSLEENPKRAKRGREACS